MPGMGYLVVGSAFAIALLIALLGFKDWQGRQDMLTIGELRGQVAGLQATITFKDQADAILKDASNQLADFMAEANTRTFNDGIAALAQTERLLYDNSINPVAAGDLMRNDRLARLCRYNAVDPACARIARPTSGVDTAAGADSRPPGAAAQPTDSEVEPAAVR